LWFTYNFNKNIIELIPHQIKAHDRDLECYIIDIKDIHIDTPPPPRICNMSTSDSCNEGASISNDDVCDVNDKLQNMSTVDKDNDTSVCANCGMEGASNMCAKCKQVKYCNAVCKKVHKKKHKKDCEEHIRLAAEHEAKLFKEPPVAEDCPICFLTLPSLYTGYKYQTCCGKLICSGCIHAPLYDNQGNKVDNKKCPFCRVVTPESDEEVIKRMMKRVEVDDPSALCRTGNWYVDGLNGFPQDYNKGLELYLRAGELGYSAAYGSIGWAYDNGEGVDQDEEKANHYYELAAMKGCAISRYNLGNKEHRAGNYDRALKHYMIAVGDGHADSLQEIQDLFTNGQVTKEDYTKALRLYQEYLSEIKSRQRDEAAAADEECRYY